MIVVYRRSVAEGEVGQVEYVASAPLKTVPTSEKNSSPVFGNIFLEQTVRARFSSVKNLSNNEYNESNESKREATANELANTEVVGTEIVLHDKGAQETKAIEAVKVDTMATADAISAVGGLKIPLTKDQIYFARKIGYTDIGTNTSNAWEEYKCVEAQVEVATGFFGATYKIALVLRLAAEWSTMVIPREHVLNADVYDAVKECEEREEVEWENKIKECLAKGGNPLQHSDYFRHLSVATWQNLFNWTNEWTNTLLLSSSRQDLNAPRLGIAYCYLGYLCEHKLNLPDQAVEFQTLAREYGHVDQDFLPSLPLPELSVTTATTSPVEVVLQSLETESSIPTSQSALPLTAVSGEFCVPTQQKTLYAKILEKKLEWYRVTLAMCGVELSGTSKLSGTSDFKSVKTLKREMSQLSLAHLKQMFAEESYFTLTWEKIQTARELIRRFLTAKDRKLLREWCVLMLFDSSDEECKSSASFNSSSSSNLIDRDFIADYYVNQNLRQDAEVDTNVDEMNYYRDLMQPRKDILYLLSCATSLNPTIPALTLMRQAAELGYEPAFIALVAAHKVTDKVETETAGKVPDVVEKIKEQTKWMKKLVATDYFLQCPNFVTDTLLHSYDLLRIYSKS